MHEAVAGSLEIAKSERSGVVADLAALTKARLSTLVLITTLVGFCMAATSGFDWLLLVHTLIGTGLVTASAAIFNQIIEMDVDRLMRRTRTRPLPAGRMKPATALLLGSVMAIGGVIWLVAGVNAVSAALAVLTLGIYLAAYTPLKRRTPLCILIGAVSGAIPPVIGWTAVRGTLDPGAWILFGILFLWQMPHFLAIAWMYRDEYAAAGFVMLRRSDVNGAFTAGESALYTVLLVGVSTLPIALGLVHPIYLAGALLLGAGILGCAMSFLSQRTHSSARRLFFASILYLPLLLCLMVFSRS